MTWEELEKIEAYLKENGYRNGGQPYHCNADHYWYKPFGKEDNPYDKGRSLYQVMFNVYDWRKYWDRDPDLRRFKGVASISVTISVSRTIDEPMKTLDFDMRDGKLDLVGIEDKAYCFYQYVNDYFKLEEEEI